MNLENIFNKQAEHYNKGYSKNVVFREMMLNKLLKIIKENEDLLLQALNDDLGNHFNEGYTTELGMLYSSIRKTIKNLHKWSKPQKKPTAFFLPFAKSTVRSVPYGKVLIMSAFNYPILLSLDPLVGSIAAGNTSMLALPSSTPNVNKVIINMLNNNFKDNYIYAFETNRHINDEILKFKFNKIFYTGSSKVGKIVLKAASENLIPTTLELGGKSPALITKNANINKITRSIVWGKLLNAGQTCVAPDYVLISDLLVDDFIENIKKSLKKLYPNGLENNPDYSKIVDQPAFERLVSLIKADQAYIINDFSKNIDEKHLGLVLLKTNINNVDKLASMQEEIFGPILPIIVYKDIREAVNYINDNDTPLAFYPFSEDKQEVNYLLEYIRFGGSTVNDTILHLSNLNLPFGGLGNSGMGNYHGKYSFDNFSFQQAVLKTNSTFKNTLMHPPFNNFKFKLIKTFLR